MYSDLQVADRHATTCPRPADRVCTRSACPAVKPGVTGIISTYIQQHGPHRIRLILAPAVDFDLV